MVPSSCLTSTNLPKVFLPVLICPHQYVYSNGELSAFNGQGGNDAYVALKGVVLDFGAFMPSHYPNIIPEKVLLNYAGKDVTALFPVQVSAMCQGKDGKVDPAVQLTFQGTNYTGQTTATSHDDPAAQYHDFRWALGNGDYRPSWLTDQMLNLEKNYWKGTVAYSPDYLTTLAGKGYSIAHIGGRVYDLSTYVTGGIAPKVPKGQKPVAASAQDYMDETVKELFQTHSGKDVTQQFQALSLDSALRHRMEVCLDNLFYVGDLDTRNSTQCLFSRYILLAISILLASVIGFKFLAALQFGKKNLPENLDKFILCTVPAYTEDEDSLRRAIDSVARMRYDDKRKLLMVLCDGMILGQGNDRPTPRIVLDILGVPPTVDPEPLSFESLGEGMKQHNMGKVYSGLYEVQGHIVPFLVVVKTGKPSEVSR